MKRLFVYLGALILVVLIPLAPIIVAPQTPATDGKADGVCAGTWVGELRSPDKKGMRINTGVFITFRLKQEGETVTGEYDTDGAGSKNSKGVSIVGTCKNNVLALSVPSVGFSEIKATIEGARMIGEMQVKSTRPSQLNLTRN